MEASSDHYETRLEMVRQCLVRGDKKLIAERLDVHRVWVSFVIDGKGTSERVLAAAEDLIKERKSKIMK